MCIREVRPFPNALFDSRDAAWLISNKMLIRCGGSARISRRVLFPDDDYITTSLDELPDDTLSTEEDSSDPPDWSTASFSTEESVFLVPWNLHSLESYQFLGFTPQKANEIWSRWLNMHHDGHQITSFIKFALDAIEYAQDDAFTTSDDWETTLRQLGINTKLQTAILKPRFEEIRLTQSAKYWAKWAVTARWEFLVAGQEASLRRGLALSRQLAGVEESVDLQTLEGETA